VVGLLIGAFLSEAHVVHGFSMTRHLFCCRKMISQHVPGCLPPDIVVIYHQQRSSVMLPLSYRGEMLVQYWSALVAAVVGLVFFFGAAAFLMLSKQDTGQSVVISSLGTAIVACVSGTSFYLYRYTMGHFKAFHLCLARTEIVLLENSVCRQIEDVTKRDAAYASVVANMEKLIFLITASQSTTQDMVNNGKEEQDTGGNPD